MILAEVCKLKYSIKKLGGKIQALCMVFTLGEMGQVQKCGGDKLGNGFPILPS
jgi:hypothetical protein